MKIAEHNLIMLTGSGFMKFNYPYKLYFSGFMFFLLIFFYGIVMLSEIFDEGKLNIIFVVIFAVFSIRFIKYYLSKIKFYMDRFLKIDERTLIYHDHELEIVIEEDNLDVIFLARHMQHLKIHKVIHVFKNDGTYYYITNEINQFDKVIEALKRTYPNNYYSTRKLIKGVNEITKGFLYYHL